MQFKTLFCFLFFLLLASAYEGCIHDSFTQNITVHTFNDLFYARFLQENERKPYLYLYPESESMLTTPKSKKVPPSSSKTPSNEWSISPLPTSMQF